MRYTRQLETFAFFGLPSSFRFSHPTERVGPGSIVALMKEGLNSFVGLGERLTASLSISGSENVQQR
jgi:hypothetical protein